jgi:hypothetical protein
MDVSKLFYFSIPKILIVKDFRLGIINRMLQLAVFSYMFVNIFHYENYYENEKPNGYITSFWAETNQMYQAQRNYSHYIDNNVSLSTTEYSHCQNNEYNYIYSLPYWDLSNVSCINVPYSEAYQKTEEELFFMTYFTENHIHIYDCDDPTYRNIPQHYQNISMDDMFSGDGNIDMLHDNYLDMNFSKMNMDCKIRDTLDGNCLCQNYKNYFTVGIESMKMVFDYKYFTSFEKGGNFEDHTSQSVITELYDVNDNIYRIFQYNENIVLTIQEFLNLVNINLTNLNRGTAKSVVYPGVVNISNYPHYRTTGIDIIIKVDCSNQKIETNQEFGTTVCRIYPMVNEGWSSKGSKITYIKYPNLNEEFIDSIYVDRYRYGIKFKFLFTGTIGNFDYFNLINTIVSAIVLFGSVSSIIVIVSSNFLCSYTDKIIDESRTESRTIEFKDLANCCCNFFNRRINNSSISDTTEELNIDTIDKISNFGTSNLDTSKTFKPIKKQSILKESNTSNKNEINGLNIELKNRNRSKSINNKYKSNKTHTNNINKPINNGNDNVNQNQKEKIVDLKDNLYNIFAI